MILLVRRMALAAAAVTLCSCGGAGGYGGGGSSIAGPGGTGGNTTVTCPTNTVCMLYAQSGNYGSGSGSFLPTSLSITHGGTVTFTNNSGVTHNVVFDSQSPPGGDIGSISSGSQDRTFPTAGNFAFHCTIHPEMVGTIAVQ